MEKQRVSMTVCVWLDPVPGAFHTKEEAEEAIQAILDNSIPHYQPRVYSK